MIQIRVNVGGEEHIFRAKAQTVSSSVDDSFVSFITEDGAGVVSYPRENLVSVTTPRTVEA